MRERQNGKRGGKGRGQPAAGSQERECARDCRRREDIKGSCERCLIRFWLHTMNPRGIHSSVPYKLIAISDQHQDCRVHAQTWSRETATQHCVFSTGTSSIFQCHVSVRDPQHPERQCMPLSLPDPQSCIRTILKHIASSFSGQEL